MSRLMPPTDARLRPKLERALPGNDVGDPDWRGVVREPWEVLFGDGDWHYVEVRAWWRDRHGRWVAQMEWSAANELWSETYLYDKVNMRKADDSVWAPPGLALRG